MNPLVVVPTYNEASNIADLVPAIYDLSPDIDILVVDSESPDGTSGVVEHMQKHYPGRLQLLRCERRSGLGGAYLAGFRHGLSGSHDIFVQMDADFSHRPLDLLKLLDTGRSAEVDFVVGSRWVNGGGTVNWGRLRRALSRGGSRYSRWILGYPLRDWTGGFNLWRRQTLERLDLDSISSEGYSFQIELKYRALRHGFRAREIPIVFEERRVGQSKMSLKIVLEALYRVWIMRLTPQRH